MTLRTTSLAVLTSLAALSTAFGATGAHAQAKAPVENPEEVYKPGTLLEDNTIVISAEKIRGGRALQVTFTTRTDEPARPGTAALVTDFADASNSCAQRTDGGRTWRIPKDEYEVRGLLELSKGPLKDGFLVTGYDPEYDAFDPYSDRYWTQEAEHRYGQLHRAVWELSTGNYFLDNSQIQVDTLNSSKGPRRVARTRCVTTETVNIPTKKR